jgi:tetratricopeptide (TPR) repeat protein
MKVPDEATGRAIALGSALHLLSAYSTMFSKKKEARDFNTAKRALNDCFQSHQLIWRLYQSSDCCHHTIKSDGEMSDFSSNVAEELNHQLFGGATGSRSPHSSAYFLWAMLAIIDVVRGNIYYQMEFHDQAKDYYTKALKRVSMTRRMAERLYRRRARLRLPTIDALTTPTLVKARFERSKIMFDRGLVLASMAQQLKCLRLIMISACNQLSTKVPNYPSAHLVKMKTTADVSSNVTRLANERTLLTRAVTFLEIEKYSPTWEKRPVLRIFGFGQNNFLPKSRGRRKAGRLLAGMDLTRSWPYDHIRPESMLKAFAAPDGKSLLLDQSTQRLVAEILARLGYSLWILRVDDRDGTLWKSRYLANWLNPFLDPPSIDSANRSPMGYYTRTFVDAEFTPARDHRFNESIDRQLALRLREEIAHLKSRKGDVTRYVSLLNETTHNIGNLVTIPQRNQRLLMRQGYLDRRQGKELDSMGPVNKLVVLRRWQSYNPKLPRPDSYRLRGGGYLLVWQGKGIVIDPGYDFIQNLYEEGFSLEDIHAVVVSHSHPDHDDDLTTLLTMFFEWHEYRHNNGIDVMEDHKIDLFLNESSYRKFSTWVHAENRVIGRIVPLPQLTWNKGSKKPYVEDSDPKRVGPKRGENVRVDLRGKDGYCMEIEVVPAWHHDVLNSTGAAGLIFHLYPEADSPTSDKEICSLGYTSDTGAYGIEDGHALEGSLLESYRNCDVLIAHLGDARLREIATLINARSRGTEKTSIPVFQLLKDLFTRDEGGHVKFDEGRFSTEKVTNILHLMTSLHLVKEDILERYKKELGFPRGRTKVKSLPAYLMLLLKHINAHERSTLIITREQLKEASYFDELTDTPKSSLACKKQVEEAWKIVANAKPSISDRFTAREASFILLATLASTCAIDWKYQYHLGVRGIEHLFRAMYLSTANRRKSRIFVVGELPEELSSYRHRIARWLNHDVAQTIKAGNRTKSARSAKPVYAYTGDIGLHIMLEADSRFKPGIRCDYCNLNNDIVRRKESYYNPSLIKETPLKALDSRMIYLCTKRAHHPKWSKEGAYYHYMFRPEIKRI